MEEYVEKGKRRVNVDVFRVHKQCCRGAYVYVSKWVGACVHVKAGSQ